MMMRTALLLLCSLAAAAAADQAVLAGRVLSAKTGQPLKRARITISRRDAGVPPRRADADRDGNFLFRGLEPGAYTVTAACQGYAEQEYGAKKPGGHGVPLTLAAGEQPPAILFRLLPHAVISGRIVDEDGDALAGVSVSASRRLGRRGPAGVGFSNDLGQYRIWGLAPGRYYVQASLEQPWEVTYARRKGAANKPQFAYTPTYYPGVSEPASAEAIEVAAGAEARGIDLRLVKTRVFHIRGQFLNAGKPAANGSVILWLRGGGPPGVQDGKLAVCDQDGAFEFLRIRPGAYTLQAHAGGPAPGGSVATLDVDVGGEDVTGIVVSMAPGIEIAGTARLEGEPDFKWREASVSVASPEVDFGPEARTDIPPDGAFALKDVQPGRRTVSAHAGPGFYLKSARFGREEVLDAAFEIPPEAPPSLELVFARADAEVSGVVRNQAGGPVAGAVLYSLDPKRSPRHPLFPAAVSDVKGRYTLKQMPPGELRLVALEQEDTDAPLELEQANALQPRATTVRLAAGARLTLDLKLLPTPVETR
jgi:hypothetical protein